VLYEILFTKVMTVASSVFADSISIILRLGVKDDHDVTLLIDAALTEVKKMEKTMVIPGTMSNDGDRDPQLFHRAHGLYNNPEKESVQVWGRAVESLWRVTMTSEHKKRSWDELTCRMLIWRSIAGEESSDICEWTRREVVGMNSRTC
jgi:nucleolar pre-ribosomal-associated protein 1